MQAQLTATETLLESIEAILAEEFSDNRPTDIYLDPEAGRLYTFSERGAIPISAYHGIDRRILTVQECAIPASVKRCLFELLDTLVSILDLYEGTEWTGRSHIGVWPDEALQLLEATRNGHFAQDLAYYMDSYDWFEPILSKLKFRWWEGATAEEIIDEEGCGDEDSLDGMCHRDDAVAWLKAEIAEWEAEAKAEDETDFEAECEAEDDA